MQNFFSILIVAALSPFFFLFNTVANIQHGSTDKIPNGDYYYLQKMGIHKYVNIGSDWEKQRELYKVDGSGKITKIQSGIYGLVANVVISPDGKTTIVSKDMNTDHDKPPLRVPIIHNTVTGRSKVLKESFESPEGLNTIEYFTGYSIAESLRTSEDQFSSDNNFFLTTATNRICVKPCTNPNPNNIVLKQIVKIDTNSFTSEVMAQTSRTELQNDAAASSDDYDLSLLDSSTLRSPSFSPDNSKIAYKNVIREEKDGKEKEQLEVIDLATKKLISTVFPPRLKPYLYNRDSISHYLWTSDSRSLVFISTNNGYPNQNDSYLVEANLESGNQIVFSEKDLNLPQGTLESLGNPNYGDPYFLPWRVRLVNNELFFIARTTADDSPNYNNKFTIYKISLNSGKSQVVKTVTTYLYGKYPELDFPILSSDIKWIIWGSTIENIQTGEKRKIMNNGEFVDWFM